MPTPPLQVSFLIATLNSSRTLRECLTSVRQQDYPQDAVEIILADAGSTDTTCDLARELGVSRIVPNPLKTGEAGKAAAAKAASGEIWILLDSDNVLPSPQWLTQMLAPFSDPNIIASEPILYTCRPQDPPLTRYFSLMGMTDPLCYFIGNYDRLCALSGRWHQYPIPTTETPDWTRVTLPANTPLPTFGANGFCIRKSALQNALWFPYWFDNDLLKDLAALAPTHAVQIAKVPCGTVHLYCQSPRDFARKQSRRVHDFLHFSPQRKRAVLPEEKKLILWGIIKFSLATLTILPLLWQMLKGYRKYPDWKAWRCHFLTCWMTLFIYGTTVLKQKCLGHHSAPLSREKWHQ